MSKPLPCTRTAPTNQEDNSCVVFAETSSLKPNFLAVFSQEGYFSMEQGSPPCCKTQRLLLKRKLNSDSARSISAVPQ